MTLYWELGFSPFGLIVAYGKLYENQIFVFDKKNVVALKLFLKMPPPNNKETIVFCCCKEHAFWRVFIAEFQINGTLRNFQACLVSDFENCS